MDLFKVENDIFVYIDDLQRVGECRYDIAIRDDRWLVVFTELVNNPGPSVTNAIENIVPQFCKNFNLKSDEVDFFERYQSHPNELDEIVFLCDNSPIWKRLPLEESTLILKALK